MTLRLYHNSAINPRQNGMNLDREPCPTVMTGGLSAFGDYWICEDATRSEQPEVSNPDKPLYRVPSMDEIRAIPWNGLTVISTFSGAGGSCTGYRMAGFRVLWANEFVPAAQASYKANSADDCFLDCRDIKHVQPTEILERTGLKHGELDLFDGSPPCQAFSTAGKREKGWGQVKQYEHGAKQCNETLFSEYVRLLRGLMPKTFIAENVSGLVKGTAKGYFLEILEALKMSGYRVACRVLDAKWLGVPQSRQRTIFVGVRNDLNKEPAHPKPLPYFYSVRDALSCITKVNRKADDGTKRRKFTIPELRRICAFPDDFILCGTYSQQWERLGNSVPPVMMRHIAECVRDNILMRQS